MEVEREGSPSPILSSSTPSSTSTPLSATSSTPSPPSSSSSTSSAFHLSFIRVGNSKCFIFDSQSKAFRELTVADSFVSPDARDCCGRLGSLPAHFVTMSAPRLVAEINDGLFLGPYLAEGRPDLRNMAIFSSCCSEGDVALLLSTGAFANLDPINVGAFSAVMLSPLTSP